MVLRLRMVQKTNTSTADSTVIDDGNGNNTALTKDGVTITTSGKDPVSLTKDGLNNGGNRFLTLQMVQMIRCCQCTSIRV